MEFSFQDCGRRRTSTFASHNFICSIYNYLIDENESAKKFIDSIIPNNENTTYEGYSTVPWEGKYITEDSNFYHIVKVQQPHVKDYESKWYYYIKIDEEGAPVLKYLRRK